MLQRHEKEAPVKKKKSQHLNNQLHLSVGWCESGPQWPCEPALQLSHTSRLPFSPLRSSLMWPSQPRDKWARTRKTLESAKNNMLSTDLLSHNANTKCSLCCNYTHYVMDSWGDSFLYVNAYFSKVLRFGDILWLQVLKVVIKQVIQVKGQP